MDDSGDFGCPSIHTPNGHVLEYVRVLEYCNTCMLCTRVLIRVLEWYTRVNTEHVQLCCLPVSVDVCMCGTALGKFVHLLLNRGWSRLCQTPKENTYSALFTTRVIPPRRMTQNNIYLCQHQRFNSHSSPQNSKRSLPRQSRPHRLHTCIHTWSRRSRDVLVLQ